ncbi:AfsR family transcriptional regulator [Streptomyces sp. CB03234]|uniref:AfsR/SARP family transcriptional regulator n=1 Tax=Streptomyces sp. (strain CB03234) TaxID=1703937 RepID=UPI00093E6AD8|nr:AfsR/SARP family transcriptional regulator [Streptomyces sp. CB03234]OKK04817.1 AfsR family transcriptional regulator [Streptomyces sp. CB03234]
MDFRVLGPVSAERDGRAVALDGSKQRTVLAALLLAGGKVLTDERLTALVWGEEPPAGGTGRLYTYVSRLRTRLGAGRGLERVGAGYRMDTGGAAFDWDVFRSAAAAGRAALAEGRWAEAERCLGGALALWRGPALTDVTEELARAEGPRMEEARLGALENLAEAALALGRHQEYVAELTRQVTAHPLRERLRGQLMTALYRSGRQADALAVYEAGRATLADELGIDPGPELRALHLAVLTGRLPGPAAPERRAPAHSTAPAHSAAPAHPAAPAAAGLPAAPAVVTVRAVPGTSAGPVPQAAPGASGVFAAPLGYQVPAAARDFTGRAAEVAEVLAALRDRRDVVVTAAPGGGASALALWAAERCREEFPDGALYADLRAEDGRARDPGEVLGWFLRSLGDEPGPAAGPAARSRRYRELLAGRRVLVVLDNAADDRQLAPLLPGSGSTRALITGTCPTLACVEGARMVWLDPLAPAEATALLATVAGARRLADDPESTARIAECCDRLPLALRIAAARLAARPHWPAARFAARLARPDRRLDELSFGGLDVRAGLRAAVARLSDEARHALVVLAASAPVESTARDAAALLGVPADEAEDLLDQLSDARLLTPAGPTPDGLPSYRLSSLVRLYAREGAASVTV